MPQTKIFHLGRSQTPTIEEVRVNNQITDAELRVLDEAGENIGVMSREEAQKIAEERGFDLVLISPKAKPPVARIIDYDKFRYQREKELKRQRRHKAPEMKRIQISARSQKNDLMTRLKKLEAFLQNGHPVEIQLTLRGREKGNKDWARGKLEAFMAEIQTPHKVTTEIKTGGRGLLVQIAPE